ncbi:MAG: hypothetical protein M3P87_06850 [Actinomycetota bacterium]|nr:hypothetical protein [Actinomycetota bacterium]
MPDSGVTLGIERVVLEKPQRFFDMEGTLRLQPGRITEMVGDSGTGLTRLGLRLLAEPSLVAPVVVLDTRCWISPEAAWETGVVPEHLVIVRCDEPRIWPKVTAALLEGVHALYAEVPAEVRDQDLRRLAALARARGVAVAMRPMGRALPGGVAHLRLRALGVTWEGADRGHGRLKKRRLVLEASGRGSAGVTRRFEVEDEGADVVRVVSDVVVGEARRSIG